MSAPSSVTLPASALDLTPADPTRIGPYRTLARLGAGGMGIVYAAMPTEPGTRPVAVKLIHTEYSADEEFRARFAREVDLLGRVGGACAVPLLAADTGADRPWLATPLVRGVTLGVHIRKSGPLDEPLLRGLAAGVAEALAQIHACGIAHRDLKPTNIILAPDGPRVLDFGVARAVDQTALTRTGTVAGSPGWISPDQYRGEPVSTGDDVFAWGALVAYAATGRPPFGTGNPAVVAHRVMSGEPDLAGFEGPLADLARRALAKRAADRPTALELVSGVVQAGVPDRAIAPIRDTGTAADAVAALLDRDWRGVRTGAERTVAPPAAPGGGARRALTLVGAGVGALALLAGLAFGGVALARNWDSLPMAAWLASDEEAEPAPEAEPTEGEARRPGPVGREPSAEPSEEASPSPEPSEPEESVEPSPEPSEEAEPEEVAEPEPEPEAPATVPITVYNAEGPCQTPRTSECSLRLANNPYAAYADPGNRAGAVWHNDRLDAACMVGDGQTISDESGYSTTRWYKVTTAEGVTGWLPGARTRDAGGVRACESHEV
ncbi:serine/threonine-protein kinase [Nocardiopsis sp. FIRDI 009]|uniref:serine/threonine-protein kinase n=1 Tax=Nocardiopsis sp. FIRDI 009 TaxID=714197 RepID=UPI0018E571E9|nr:serine/threonine-protein kinase [Nocardiopsis sp. FIRDI 009]